MKIPQNPFWLLLFFVATQHLYSQTEKSTPKKTELQTKLMEVFPKAEIMIMENLEGYSESYQIILNEPVDNKNSKKGTFKHYIYLSHLDYKSPMVIETEGYAARYVKNELSGLLHANQLIVEYRFYGKS